MLRREVWEVSPKLDISINKPPATCKAQGTLQKQGSEGPHTHAHRKHYLDLAGYQKRKTWNLVGDYERIEGETSEYMTMLHYIRI